MCVDFINYRWLFCNDVNVIEYFAFRFYYEVEEKYIISSKSNFLLSFLSIKSQRQKGVIYLHRDLVAEKIFCMYLMAIKFGYSLYRLCSKIGSLGPIGVTSEGTTTKTYYILNLNSFTTTCLIFHLKVR